jgi:hypothetical protein
MSTPGATEMPTGARTLEAGALLAGLGSLLLLVSLFLEWYQPGYDAWNAFEVWDLVLALLAIGALVAVASRLGFGPPRPVSWLAGCAGAVLVIVVHALLDPPPATAGVLDADLATGLWLALAAAILMTVGAVLSVARISVAITTAGPVGRDRVDDPVVAGTEARGARFARRGDSPLGDEAGAPVGRGTAGVPPTEPTRRV